MRISQPFTSYRNIAVKQLSKGDHVDSDSDGAERPTLSDGLSSEQSADLEALLAQFDADQFNAADAQALVTGIMDLGIKPSKALGEALRQAGFDPFVLAQKGDSAEQTALADMVQTGMRGQINMEALDALSRLVEHYGESDLSPDDWSTLFAELEAKGHDMSRPLVDVRF